MIIWGSRGLTSVVESANFHCPQCSAPANGTVKQVRNFFTLYFIPIIPLNVAGRYVECGSCGGSFSEEILHYDPAQEREQFNTNLLRTMIMAAMADGKFDDGEITAIKKQYRELTGLPIASGKLNEEMQLAASSGTDLNRFVAGFAGDLAPHGKALVVKTVFDTMCGSDEMTDEHHRQLAELAKTLQIPEDVFAELIDEFSQGTSD